MFLPLTAPPDELDHIILAGRRSPGLATIEGAGTPRDFDERRGFGIGFARLRFRGVKLSRFKVLLRLLTEEHWREWHDWKGLVARPEGESTDAYRRRVVAGGALQVAPQRAPQAPPMDIVHPILADMGITSCVVEDVLQPVQTGDGEWTIEIRCIEYRAPIPQLELTQGSQSRDLNADNGENQIGLNTERITWELSNPNGLAGS